VAVVVGVLGREWGKGGEMTQTLYAHMKKQTKQNKQTNKHNALCPAVLQHRPDLDCVRLSMLQFYISLSLGRSRNKDMGTSRSFMRK
jgi:hypothetical protein